MAEETKTGRNVTLIAAAILGLGIVAGGYLMGDGLRRARMADRAVTVRGLAERNVTADLATWDVSFSAQGTDLGSVQSEIDRDSRTITNFFQQSGFPGNAVSDGGGSINSFYDADRGGTVYTISRSLVFRSNDVMRAQRAYSRQFDLIRNGVELSEGSGMVFSFTRLNEVKPDMITASIQDARNGAERFARDSGTSVGGIRTATQGYFSIGARDGDEDTGGGGGGDSPLQKVRVVTTIEFYLD